MSSRPRILLLVTLAETGGAQTYVGTLASALAGQFDVTVGAHGRGPLQGVVAEAGATFVPLRYMRREIGPRDLLALAELVLVIRRLRPHIVHASSSKAGVLGRFAAWLTRVPIRLFTVHGWAFSAHAGSRSRLYELAERMVRPLTTLTVCVSESERDAGLAARTCDAKRSVVIHTGIDVASFGVARPAEEPPAIVAVGRLRAPKDSMSLIRALALLRGPFHATLVGRGPDQRDVEDEVRRANLTGSVLLAGERDDVPELLASSAIFVLSSRSEALPVSVLEAMAAGLPVVGTRVGGVPELVVEEKTGLLVPPADPPALAAALQRLLDDPELRARFGAAGRARVEERFTLDSFVESHLDLYRRALAARGLPLPSP